MVRRAIVIILAAGLLAFARPVSAQSSGPVYVVQPDDTLYSIAFRYGLDFRGLAAANRIAEPYRIYPGQKLRLTTAAPAPAKPAKPAVAKTPRGKPVAPAETAKPAPAPTALAAPPAAIDASSGNGKWQWPVPGKIIGNFSADGIGPKGLALAGNTGDPVHAARGGRVVYTGSSLVGYGQLVIIKHDDVYLSAYAHNSKLLVKEGEVVKAGDVIAEMGSSGTDRTELHFEVRRNGDPIDPLQVLPAR